MRRDPGASLVGRPREGSVGGRIEFRSVLACQILEDTGPLAGPLLPCFTANGPPLHLQPAPVRICSVRGRRHNRRVQRAGPITRMWRAGLQLAVEPLEPLQDTPHAHDGVSPVPWTAAMRRAAGVSIRSTRTLCGRCDLKVGWLGDDGAIGRPVFDQRVGADARILLVDNRRDDQPPARNPFAAAGPHRSSRPRRPSCLEIRARTGGRRESPARKRVHPSTPTVSTCPQNISDRPGAPPPRTARDIRAPGCGLLHDATSSHAARIVRDERRDLASPAAPGTSDGLTESIATSSDRRTITGSSLANAQTRTPTATSDWRLLRTTVNS